MLSGYAERFARRQLQLYCRKHGVTMNIRRLLCHAPISRYATITLFALALSGLPAFCRQIHDAVASQTKTQPKKAAAGVNLTGSWHLEVAFQKQGIEGDEYYLDLKQTGTKIRGTSGGNEDVRGTIDGSSVTLTITVYFASPPAKKEAPGPPGAITLRPATAVNLIFNGTLVKANAMQGTVDFGQHGGLGKWTAKRSD